MKNYFSKEIHSVISQGIKINILGEINKLPAKLKKILNKSDSLRQEEIF